MVKAASSSSQLLIRITHSEKLAYIFFIVANYDHKTVTVSRSLYSETVKAR